MPADPCSFPIFIHFFNILIVYIKGKMGITMIANRALITLSLGYRTAELKKFKIQVSGFHHQRFSGSVF